jgi:hypothetical protein
MILQHISNNHSITNHIINNQWDLNKTSSANQVKHHQFAKDKESSLLCHNVDELVW